MNLRRKILSLALPAALLLNAHAATRYVNLNSPSPTPPYTNWLTAATNIQNAIDAAVAGDLVLVTNGVYATGGRVVSGALTNRVVVDKAITLESVNGPLATIIQGNPANNNTAVRCVYMTNNAALTGFTLTNGATRIAGDSTLEQSGAGVWCASTNAAVSNCVISKNSAGMNGGGAYAGKFLNCTFRGNFATNPAAQLGYGGGAYGSILIDCTLTNNSAHWDGGGAAVCTLSNCMVAGNVSAGSAGGVYASTLNNCTVTGNHAGFNGGASGSGTLNNCQIIGNSAATNGGGATSGTLNNCTLIGNSAPNGGAASAATLNFCIVGGNSGGSGGGTYQSTLTGCLLTNNTAASGGGAYAGSLYGCTVVSNVATSLGLGGGGAYGAALYDCVLYFNSANLGQSNNYSGGTLRYCCTSPLASGVGNFTNPPSFVDLANGDLRLQSNSPCINSGNNGDIASAPDWSGFDLDGNLRQVGSTVDVGAYEFQSPVSALSYAWAQQNGLPTDGSADFTDADGDGASNWQEWRADTSPTNPASALLMGKTTNGVTGLVVSWASVATRSYWLERATNLSITPSFQLQSTNIAGVAGTTTYNDPTATNGGPYFYRVGVQ